ncbi:hypothetical protein AHAS_Ahas19G0185200 [Arachis hypogaea]
MEFNSSYDQTNFMGYYPPSPISNGGWEYHQENTHSEHSNSWRFASETQDEQENHMGYLSPPQNDASCYSNDGWGEQNQKTFESPYSTYQEPSSLERTINSLIQNFPTSPSSFSSENSSSLDFVSTQNPCQNSPPTQTSMNQRLSKLESMLKRIAEEKEKYQKEQENSFKNMEAQLAQLVIATKKEEKQEEEATESSGFLMKNEVVENETALEMTREHEDSQLSQTFLTQKLSKIESVIEKYEEEMKKCWEDQQTSSMKKLLSQMLGGEEHESEEVIPENLHSSEAEKYMKEEFMEPPIQKALDEYKIPITTQQPSLESKEVKATSKNTNSVPNPASKLNQAMYKRKLAERKPRKGTIAETSPPLRSFLLTNWKKRKKVNNMSTVGIISLLCFVFVLCFL